MKRLRCGLRTVLLTALITGLSWFPAWADLDEGLIAHYPFNGNAKDESGNGHDGTIIGATLTEDRLGSADSAYNFDGINDKIEIPDYKSTLAPSTLTISVWAMRIGQNGGDGETGIILYKGNYDPNPNMAYSIEIQDDTYSLILRSDTAGGDKINTVSMELNQWYHLLGVFDNETKQKSFYVNGVLRGRVDFDGEINQKAEPLCLGAYCYNDGYFFNGHIDDFRIYNRALFECEIQSLYTGEDECKPNVESPTDDKTPVCTPTEPTPTSGDCMATYSLDGTVHIPCISVPDAFDRITVYDIKMQNNQTFLPLI